MTERDIRKRLDTERVTDLRARIRGAMDVPPAKRDCPLRIDNEQMLPARRA
ncbi:MAG: hypothetical protein ABGY41_15470 [Candidatus Poribacteria bacterium]